MLKVVGASWMQIRMSTWIIGMVLVLGIVVIILGEMGHLEEDGNYSATAYWNKETGFDIKFWGQGMDKDKIPKGVARIYFQPHIDTTGWAIIDIETQENYPDWIQAYAAGMLEGSLSWQLIYWHWQNTVQSTCANRKVFCNYIRKYLEENLKSVKKYFENTEDPFWHQVHLFYIQLEGIQQGFEHGVKRSRQNVEELKFVDFLWMNAASDIVDLEYKFLDTKPYIATLEQSQDKNFLSESVLLKKMRNARAVDGYSNDNDPKEEIDQSDIDENRPFIGCGVTLGSAFIKIIPEEGELYVAHNSAGPYMTMLKMVKHYLMRYHWSATEFWMAENKMSFSSYPGVIHSMDDFYVVSMGSQFTNVVIAGTPITVFNKKLWKNVSPFQVLSGPRTVAATRLSKNATTWAEILSKHNSGTGNKEWVIVDIGRYKNITRLKEEDEDKFREELQKAKNLLWVVEQIPGHFEMTDQTDILKSQSYWASYGLPFSKNISIISGVESIREKYGDSFSYENSPLAKIYRRDHFKATGPHNVMRLMRSNSYRKDPLSLGNPRCAVGARGDIPTQSSYSFPIGVTDSKVFSLSSGPDTKPNKTLQRDDEEEDDSDDEMVLQVAAGPAFTFPCSGEAPDPETGLCSDEDKLEPFSWSGSIFSSFAHNGHPDSWTFRPIYLT